MFKTTIKSTTLWLLGSCLMLLSSCGGNFWTGAPYTSVSKMTTLKAGMTLEEVNNTLGIPAYDIYHLQEDGGTLLTYQYRKQYRKKIVSSEHQMHDQASQTAGNIWYKDAANLYVFLKENKMQAMVTDAGIRDGEALLIDDNMIQVITKENIDLFLLAKNEGVTDSTHRYAIKTIKETNKVSIYQTYWMKQKIEVTVQTARPAISGLTTSKIKRTRTLPAYPTQVITDNNKNSISVGLGYANMPSLTYEREILKRGRLHFGAAIGLGIDFYNIRGFANVTFPFYTYAALGLGKHHYNMFEVNLGGSFSYGYGYGYGTDPFGRVRFGYGNAAALHLVPLSVGYRLSYKGFLMRVGGGFKLYDSYQGRPHLYFSLGYRF